MPLKMVSSGRQMDAAAINRTPLLRSSAKISWRRHFTTAEQEEELSLERIQKDNLIISCVPVSLS